MHQKICVLSLLVFLLGSESRDCDFNVKIEQILLNEGFHRNLSIYMDFASDDDRESLLYEDCKVGIEQVLPSGLYASPDEIKNYHSCVDLLYTSFLTPANIELPEKQAKPLVIHMFSRVRRRKLHIHIPVHARYHQAASEGGSIRNEIAPPKINLLCAHDRLEVCDNIVDELRSRNNFCESNKPCRWKEIPVKMVTDTPYWDVPIGNTDHYFLVTSITILVVIVSSLYLLKTIHEYKVSSEQGCRKKK